MAVALWSYYEHTGIITVPVQLLSLIYLHYFLIPFVVQILLHIEYYILHIYPYYQQYSQCKFFKRAWSHILNHIKLAYVAKATKHEDFSCRESNLSSKMAVFMGILLDDSFLLICVQVILVNKKYFWKYSMY